MVEEILVKESLSAQEIAAGEELLKRLDQAKAEVIAAYWIYSPSIGFWRLEIVSPQVKTDGPLEYYTKIRRLLSTPTRIPCGLGLNIINALEPNHHFYKLLRSAIKSEKDLAGIRLTQYVVGDEIVDLYIYRFPRTNGLKK
jgi:hypothetical protein